MTEHKSIREKIIKHLDGLNNLERQQDMDIVIDTIAKRYNTPREIVIKSISEWSAGDRKTKNEPESDNKE
jgi:hypothetical protein